MLIKEIFTRPSTDVAFFNQSKAYKKFTESFKKIPTIAFEIVSVDELTLELHISLDDANKDEYDAFLATNASIRKAEDDRRTAAGIKRTITVG